MFSMSVYAQTIGSRVTMHLAVWQLQSCRLQVIKLDDMYGYEGMHSAVVYRIGTADVVGSIGLYLYLYLRCEFFSPADSLQNSSAMVGHSRSRDPFEFRR